jgi:cell division transport system permease protein
MFSLASIATMTACIFLLGVFYSIGMNFESMVRNAEEGVAVTVLFNEGITQDQIDAIGEAISARNEVSKYEFISAEQAWETYKVDYFNGDEEAAAVFADDNPLANSASYSIYLNDVSMQQSLVTYLEGLDGVREVHYSDVAAKTLTDFNRLLKYISLVLIVILIAVAAFLISNTITVGISVRKEEIAIMKLIGAKDTFVRAPFVVEGIVIGLVGSAIPLVLLLILYQRILNYVAERFHALSNLFSFVPAADIFRFLVPVSLILGVGIGLVGSRITLHRHLKV